MPTKKEKLERFDAMSAELNLMNKAMKRYNAADAVRQSITARKYGWLTAGLISQVQREAATGGLRRNSAMSSIVVAVVTTTNRPVSIKR